MFRISHPRLVVARLVVGSSQRLTTMTTTTPSNLVGFASRRSLALSTAAAAAASSSYASSSSSSSLIATTFTSHHHHHSPSRHVLLLTAANHNTTTTTMSRRYYTPLTPDQERAEQERVKNLTREEKESELREYNRQMAKLEMLRGINTGEWYTLRGKFKYLSRNYGLPFVLYYWTVWGGTAVVSYAAITVGGIDAVALLAQVEAYTGYALMSQQISPEVGTVGLTIMINELLEPIRLPFVVFTTIPVVNFFFPTKY